MDILNSLRQALDFYLFIYYPGVYRIACEVTMQLLRDNKDSLMSVLDAFIYDPLVEWEDEKRKLVMISFTSFGNIDFYYYLLMNDLYIYIGAGAF